MRSHVETELIPFVSMSHVSLLLFVEDRMDQGLVEVKHQELLF